MVQNYELIGITNDEMSITNLTNHKKDKFRKQVLEQRKPIQCLKQCKPIFTLHTTSKNKDRCISNRSSTYTNSHTNFKTNNPIKFSNDNCKIIPTVFQI